MILEVISAMAVGFVGSVHCLGMCGPIVLAYSLQLNDPGSSTSGAGRSPVKAGANHHVAFHAGRLVSYGLLGASAAALFGLVGKGAFGNFRGGAVVAGGLLMIYFGLVLLRYLPLPRFLSLPPLGYGSLWGKALSRILLSTRPIGRVGVGLAAGLLPCGLSWAMIARAGATQDVTHGFLVMTGFGLGTVPALFLTGFSASFLSLKMRFIGEKIAALSIVVMGLMLIFKGARALV